MDFGTHVKTTLLSIISDMSSHASDFARCPSKDFTRNRKLDFSSLILCLMLLFFSNDPSYLTMLFSICFISLSINEKCSCCADMLKICDAKYMNVGSKEKINQFVDFSYAYGNIATQGFKEIGEKRGFPITLIPKNIDEFVIQKYRIKFVFEKALDEEQYDKPIVEIKKEYLRNIMISSQRN